MPASQGRALSAEERQMRFENRKGTQKKDLEQMGSGRRSKARMHSTTQAKGCGEKSQ